VTVGKFMMIEEAKDKPQTPDPLAFGKPPICTCVQDTFHDLPPELRPRSRDMLEDLHKVTCHGCGKVYWTNRETDWCAECEEKGAHLPDVPEVNNNKPE